jgi:hypothetical protein
MEIRGGIDVNSNYLEGLIQQYCKDNHKDEAKVWEDLVEIYKGEYGVNLEYLKKEYCEAQQIGFLGMAEYCEIRLCLGDMLGIFNGYIGKGHRCY